MNQLESLITQQVQASVVATVSHTTDKIAEAMAREMLRDPEFKTYLRELVRRAFKDAMERLAQPVSTEGDH